MNVYALYALAAIVYLWFRVRPQPHLDGSSIVSDIRTLSDIVGQTEAEFVVDLIDEYAANPTVLKRCMIMNAVTGWTLRRTDHPVKSEARIADVSKRLDRWTLSMLSSDITDWDAPRPSNFVDSSERFT